MVSGEATIREERRPTDRCPSGVHRGQYGYGRRAADDHSNWLGERRYLRDPPTADTTVNGGDDATAFSVMVDGTFDDEFDGPFAARNIRRLSHGRADRQEVDLVLPGGLSRETLKVTHGTFTDTLSESSRLLADECTGVADADAIEEISDRFGVDSFESR